MWDVIRIRIIEWGQHSQVVMLRYKNIQENCFSFFLYILGFVIGRSWCGIFILGFQGVGQRIGKDI